MSWTEFVHWCALANIEPFGHRHEELRWGTVATLLFNPNRKSGARALGPEDLFPSLKEQEETGDSPEEQRRRWLGWAIYLGAKIE